MLFRCAKTGSVALICWLAQQHAAFTAKIGIYNLHKRCAEFLNACTASNASAYDYLTTYPRSSLYLALTGAAVNMLCMQLRASSSTFSACVSTYSVDTEQLVWCLYGVGCSGTSRSLRVSIVQETSRCVVPLDHHARSQSPVHAPPCVVNADTQSCHVGSRHTVVLGQRLLTPVDPIPCLVVGWVSCLVGVTNGSFLGDYVRLGST